jgi:sodium-dependent dicarboxylate transporter 2/3/5
MEDTGLSGKGRFIAVVAGVTGAILAGSLTARAGLTAPAANLAAVTVLMAVFWGAQPIPIAVTSLFPIALYPLLGIADSRAVCAAYADPNVFLYLGGFIIALGLERWNLHRRIALGTVRLVGSSPRRLVLGFAFATAFLSMWISNTATTLLMLPIAMSLVQMLEEELPRLAGTLRQDELNSSLREFTIALLLAVAFGATCGGLATLVGTPTNTSFRGFWERQLVPAGEPPLSQGAWIIAFLPLAILMLLGVCVMTTRHLRSIPGAEQLGREFCTERLRALGRMGSGERRMLVIFVATAALWITREPLSFGARLTLPGWGVPLANAASRAFDLDPSRAARMFDDSTIAILMAISLFLVRGRRSGMPQWEPLMTWRTVEERVPWGVLLLFGGGFALADAFRTTGLADWLGTNFAGILQGAPLWLTIAGVCGLVTLLSEFTSNVATINTVLPVLAPLAISLDVSPHVLLIPAAISASFGFMLPVATPPNAIVFGTGRIPISAMMRYGFALDVLGVALITVFALTVVPAVFSS